MKHDDLVRYAEKFAKLPGGGAEVTPAPCPFTGSDVSEMERWRKERCETR